MLLKLPKNSVHCKLLADKIRLKSPQIINFLSKKYHIKSFDGINDKAIISTNDLISKPNQFGTPIEFYGNWEYLMTGSIFWPSNIVERFIELVHIYSGFSWFGSILFYGICVKLLVLPLNISNLRSNIVSKLLSSKIKKFRDEIQILKGQNQFEKCQLKSNQLNLFLIENGINPLKNIAFTLIQTPLFMASFFALRNMCDQPIVSFLDQGILWFPNLAQPDTTHILPAISSFLILTSFEVIFFSQFD